MRFTGSYEQSPRFLTGCGRERYGTRRCDSESSISDMVPKVEMELQLKENLADAMQEMPLVGSNVPGTSFLSLYILKLIELKVFLVQKKMMAVNVEHIISWMMNV